MSQRLTWILVAAVCSAVVVAGVTWRVTRATGPAYTCVAGPDEQCPSDQWIKEYREFKGLVNKYQAPQAIQDQMNGMRQRLSAQIPQGYDMDEKKERWVKQKPPLAAQAPGTQAK